MQKKRLFSILLIVVLSSIMLFGCGKSPEEARKELGQMNIQYTELSFLKAIENNDSVATKLFLEAGMDPNVNVDGVTPLMMAATKNRIEIAKSLIEKKANVNAKSKEGMTALGSAIAGDSDGPGNIDVVKLLLEKGADVNVQTTVEKMTPIMIAVAKGDVAIVKELIGKGADVNLKADKGITALIVAKKMKKQEVVDILLQAGAKDETPVATPVAAPVTVAGQNASPEMELAKKIIYGKWRHPEVDSGYKYDFNENNIRILKIISINPNGESEFKVQIKNDSGNWMNLDTRMVVTFKKGGYKDTYEMNIIKRKDNGNLVNDGEDRIRYEKV